MAHNSTLKEMIRRLNDESAQMRILVLSQLTRNLYAINYWDMQLSRLNDRPDLKKGNVKRMYNRCQGFITRYRAALMELIHTEEARDIYMDSVYEFHKQLERMVGLYSEAIKRRIDKLKTKESSFLYHFATAKDLLDLCQIMQSYELKTQLNGMPPTTNPSVWCMLHIGGFSTAKSYAAQEAPEDFDRHELPSTMGFLLRLCGDMNKVMLAAVGENEKTYEFGSDKEIDRSIEICTKNIVRLMQDYEHINVMFEDDGHTYEEADEIIQKRLAEHEAKKQKAEEKAKLKQAKKDARQS